MTGILQLCLTLLIGRPCRTDCLLPTLVVVLQVGFCSKTLIGSFLKSGVRLFGFGAVHMEGLGVGYMINDDSLPGTVSSYSGKAQIMADNVVKALRELSQLCESAK